MRREIKTAPTFLIVVRSLDRAIVDFTALRGACEIMNTVVTTLYQRKDRRGLTPAELDNRLAAEAGHLKIVPTVQRQWRHYFAMPEGF